MIYKVIIGAGFSAGIAKLLINDAKVFGATDHKIAAKNCEFKRTFLASNKLFSKKSHSYGALRFNKSNVRLHDRLIINGNSAIWGGFINYKKISASFKEILLSRKIKINKLSIETSGSYSDNSSIGQLTNKFNRIMEANDILPKIENVYLKKISVKNKKIVLEFINTDLRQEIIVANFVVLCIGTVQLIDLLYRSGLITEGDKIELNEFTHSIRFEKVNKKSADKKNTKIKFTLLRAFFHYIGLQHNKINFSFLNKFTFQISQTFIPKAKKCEFKIINANLVPIAASVNFGDSIHYCNMKINGVHINKFLKIIHPKLTGLGMSFVNQKTPGPISNDIINDACEKLK